MDSSETKNIIRPEGCGVEYAVPGRSPTIVDMWRLFKTSSSARKVIATLITMPFKYLFKLCQRQDRIFGFARRRGIFTGTGSYQVKWEIVMLILFFPAQKKKKNTISTTLFQRKNSDVFLLLRIIFWPNHQVEQIFGLDT